MFAETHPELIPDTGEGTVEPDEASLEIVDWASIDLELRKVLKLPLDTEQDNSRRSDPRVFSQQIEDNPYEFHNLSYSESYRSGVIQVDLQSSASSDGLIDGLQFHFKPGQPPKVHVTIHDTNGQEVEWQELDLSDESLPKPRWLYNTIVAAVTNHEQTAY